MLPDNSILIGQNGWKMSKFKKSIATKVHEKCQKWSILTSFGKSKACGQTALPDKSLKNNT